ncbi:MAG TPA: polysaccharide biosynthesis/export family protein [Chthoniobacterales bacterium]
MNTRVLQNALALCVMAWIIGAFSPAVYGQDAPLRTGDSVELRIGGVPPSEAAALNNSYTIDNDGNLKLAYIGKVSVVGKTAGQAADFIESIYKNQQIYSNPTITVSTLNTSPRFVNVGGEVRNVSRVPYTTDLTLLSAINAAAGFTEFANRKKVRLIRGKEVRIIDCTKIMVNPELDIPVLPGDQIYVEQSWL